MRSSRVSPTLPLNAPIESHLEAAGVSHPIDIAHRMAEQEYDSWHEVVMLNSGELKDLMDLVGLKHKSATKLSRYADDYRRYNQQEITAERPESRDITSHNGVQEDKKDALVYSNLTDQESLTNPHETNEEVQKISTNNPPKNENENSQVTISAEPTLPNDDLILNDDEGESPKLNDSMDNDIHSVSSIHMSATESNNIIASNELIEKATSAAQEHSNFDVAVNLFRDAIEFNQNSVAAWFGLGYSLYQRDGGNTEEQISCYERAIELNPKHAMARSNLGNQLLTLRKEFKNAELQFRTAIDLDKSCADAHNHLGWLLQHSKEGPNSQDSDEAEQLFRAAIALDPAYTDAHVNLGWLLHDVRKDLAGAETCYRMAIDLDPNNVQANYNLGLLLDGQGDAGEKAEERYRRAIELDPNNVLALISLGSLLETVRRDVLGAEKCYRDAIQIDPSNPNAYNCLGVLLETSNPPKVEDAESCYRKAIDLDAAHSSATYNLGLLLEVVKRDYDGAEACYRRTIELDPNNANAHSNLGILLKDVRRDFDGAEGMYRQAIALDPSHSAACNNLGTLLETVRGDIDGAEAMYRRAMELDITNVDAVLNLGILLHGKAEKLEHQLKQSISTGGGADSPEAIITPDRIQTALSIANMYCEAAALWDISDGEGNKYSTASRLSASQLRALCSSRPNTPQAGSTSNLHSNNLSPIHKVSPPVMRPSRPSSARSRPTSATNHRPTSAQGSRPASQSGGRPRAATTGGFTGLPSTENAKAISPILTSSTHISPQDAAIVSGIGISADPNSSQTEVNTNEVSARPWAAAAAAAEKAAQELAAVAVKLESYSIDQSALDSFKLDGPPTSATASTSDQHNKPSFAGVVNSSNRVINAVDNLHEGAILRRPTLSSMDGGVMFDHFDGDDDELLVSIFRVVDRNGDGGVSRLELNRALNKKGEEGAMLRGKLCSILGLPTAITSKKARGVFELVFDCVDSDGGATLELDEMQAFVKDMKRVADIYEKSQSPEYNQAEEDCVDPRIVGLLEASDRDNDGQLSHVEIIQAMKLFPDIRMFLNNEK